eukprot:1501687-Amphidinium_carterae.1
MAARAVERKRHAISPEMNVKRPRASGSNEKVGAGQGGKDQRRADGRYYCALDGRGICYTWARAVTGCSEDGCPHERAQV